MPADFGTFKQRNVWIGFIKFPEKHYNHHIILVSLWKRFVYENTHF